MLLLSAALLVVIVYAVGFRRTADAVRDAGVLSFAAVGVLTLATQLIQAASLAILNRPIKHCVPFHTLFEATIVGLAGNIVTPSTYLGGEAFKVLYVGRAAGLPYRQVTGTVVLSKYLEAISFVLFFTFSAVVATVSYRSDLFGSALPVGLSLVAVEGFLLILCVALIVSLSRRWRPLTRLVRVLLHLPFLSRRLTHLQDKTREMEDQVSRVFCEEGRAAWQVFGVQLVGHVTIFLRPAVFFYLGAYHLKLDLGQLGLLFVVSQALLSFQLTPSGAGMLDTGLIGAFALMGLDTPQEIAQCMAFLLCLRLWDAVAIGAGALLGARVGTRVLSSQPRMPAAPESPGSEAPCGKTGSRP